MPEIEFEQVLGRIEDTARQERERAERRDGLPDREQLFRLIAEERQAARWRTERLRA